MNQSPTFGTDNVIPLQDTPQPTSPTYTEYQKTFNRLITAFESGEKDKCAKRREFRRHHVNVAQERKNGTLLADETKIPDRTIESNIRRDKSPLVQLLTQPTTVLSFTDAMNPGRNFAPLANAYTDLNRVTGWQIEWFYLIDAIEMHGAGYLEVYFNDKSPIKTSVQYVRRDHLIFPAAARSLNACTELLRKYEFTKSQFQEFAKTRNFDPAQTLKVVSHYEQKEEQIIFYRALMRISNVYHVAYFVNSENICNDWLLPPTPYDIGMREPAPVNPLQPEAPQTFVAAPVTESPIFVFPLDLEEDEEILKTQGRVSLDLHVQEAMTALLTSIINTSVRAAGLYPTRKRDLENPPTNQESFVFKHGHINDGDFTFGKLEWPSAVAVSIAQFLRTHAASQSGGIDWAAMNRADTAKTATELTLAQKESDSLRSMATTLFALCMLQVELLRFNIWRSQIAAGLIEPPACCVMVNPQTGEPNPDAIDLFSPSLVPTLSADQQVIRRAEETTRFMQYWPFVQGSPYQLPMLETMLQDAFPQYFPLWTQKAQQMLQQQNISQQSLALLQQAFDQLKQLPLQAVNEQQQQNIAALLDAIGGLLETQAQTQPQNART